MTLPRRLALAATTVVALSALTACGSSDSSSASSSDSSSSAGSSSSASSSSSSSTAAGGDLCQAFAAGPQGLSSNDPATAVSAAHDFASELQGVSTSGLSSSAASGLQAYTAFLGGIDVAAIKKLEANSEASPSDVFGDKADDVEAFFGYVQQTCAPQLSSTPTPSSPAS